MNIRRGDTLPRSRLKKFLPPDRALSPDVNEMDMWQKLVDHISDALLTHRKLPETHADAFWQPSLPGWGLESSDVTAFCAPLLKPRTIHARNDSYRTH